MNVGMKETSKCLRATSQRGKWFIVFGWEPWLAVMSAIVKPMNIRTIYFGRLKGTFCMEKVRKELLSCEKSSRKDQSMDSSL